MKTEKLILISELFIHYEVNSDFFDELESFGLVEIQSIDEQKYIPRKQLGHLEKILNLHRELNINFEGIDVIFQMMNRIQELEKQLMQTQSKLNLYQ